MTVLQFLQLAPVETISPINFTTLNKLREFWFNNPVLLAVFNNLVSHHKLREPKIIFNKEISNFFNMISFKAVYSASGDLHSPENLFVPILSVHFFLDYETSAFFET